ncbi:hypothetical protein SAY87_015443 [Trapa incisa]|uniref:Cyanobacterial aminoacyl-tRNA synthetase CAAD domain-containing protein n=1 Tax=Trapa incisa TaxID=236973 RepID=A0AAN7H3R9_9MYRT|nr:hypothetical protein SAY87_015443 [Trapa incisa]
MVLISNPLLTPISFPSRGLSLQRKHATCSRPPPDLGPSDVRRIFHRQPLRVTTSEDASGGVDLYFDEGKESVNAVEVEVQGKAIAVQSSFAESFSSAASEPPPTDQQEQSFVLMDNVDLKFDSEDILPIVLFGSGALVALWLASAVVVRIDTIPVLPRLLEAVGVGYTVWFTWRYLIFKKNREEMINKISEIKQQVLGSKDD